MPWIVEEDRQLQVSPLDAERLVARGLVVECHGCGHYHHEEYERWEEIVAFLQLAEEFVAFTRPM